MQKETNRAGFSSPKAEPKAEKSFHLWKSEVVRLLFQETYFPTGGQPDLNFEILIFPLFSIKIVLLEKVTGSSGKFHY